MNLEMETSIVLSLCLEGKGEYLYCPGWPTWICSDSTYMEKLEACRGGRITSEPCTKSAVLSEATRTTSSTCRLLRLDPDDNVMCLPHTGHMC